MVPSTTKLFRKQHEKWRLLRLLTKRCLFISLSYLLFICYKVFQFEVFSCSCSGYWQTRFYSSLHHNRLKWLYCQLQFFYPFAVSFLATTWSALPSIFAMKSVCAVAFITRVTAAIHSVASFYFQHSISVAACNRWTIPFVRVVTAIVHAITHVVLMNAPEKNGVNHFFSEEITGSSGAADSGQRGEPSPRQAKCNNWASTFAYISVLVIFRFSAGCSFLHFSEYFAVI